MLQVFDHSSTQSEIFAEVSQLAQSCTDGYNVCIFAYGQTGSGKSWTMEGGPVRFFSLGHSPSLGSYLAHRHLMTGV